MSESAPGRGDARPAGKAPNGFGPGDPGAGAPPGASGRRRFLSRLAWTLVVLLVVAAGYTMVRRSLKGSHDFDGFHRGAAHLVETATFPTARNVARYPPTFPLLLAPFGALPLGLAATLWYLVSVACLAALPRLVERLSDVPPSGQLAGWLVALPFLLDDLMLGQSGPLLLVAVTGSLVLARRGRGLVAGLVLGGAVLFKVLPGAFVLVPLVMGDGAGGGGPHGVGRRGARGGSGRGAGVLAGVALALAAGVGLCLAVAGVEGTAGGFAHWLETVRLNTPPALVATDRSLRFNNQGLAITLARTFGDLGGAQPTGAVRVASLPLPWIWLATGAVAAAWLAVAARGALAARRLGDGEAWLGLLAVAASLLLLASPIVWTHYFVWILPAVVALRHRRRLVLVGGTLFAVGVAFEPLRSLGLHIALALAATALVSRDLARRASRRGELLGPRDGYPLPPSIHSTSPPGRK